MSRDRDACIWCGEPRIGRTTTAHGHAPWCPVVDRATLFALTDRGYPRPPRGLTSAEVVAARSEGLTWHEVAARFGVGRSTVLRRYAETQQ